MAPMTNPAPPRQNFDGWTLEQMEGYAAQLQAQLTRLNNIIAAKKAGPAPASAAAPASAKKA